MKNVLNVVVVIVVGSLLGQFINKAAALWLPAGGRLASLMNTAIHTGLSPATLDLSILEVTGGLIFKFNIASVAGIFIAAMIYKQLIK